MTFDEINDKLTDFQNYLLVSISIEKLTSIYLEIAFLKSELHQIIHFCNDEYEKKKVITSLEKALALQNISYTQITDYYNSKKENIINDLEIEKRYIEKELESQINEAILFKEFCKLILPKKEFSKINELTKHCKSLNVNAKNYIFEKMFETLNFDERAGDIIQD
ncbi:hypothetical protein SAMN02927937_00871 [Paenimyroides aquimaris]|uniref:Uncharacterized protein n=1 Tax=Paenimyroides marinum TaxID=1159016 RepID=A0A1H6K7Y8_9FLAO|nr:hypothetical protein [Paenimyroides aquimaris]SEH68565.1 hypothetical protein SAMN02927937_00871 [Paenimyroides aquimaris]